MVKNSITRRWLINVFGLLTVLLIAFNIAFGMIVSSVYYDNARRELQYTASQLARDYRALSADGSSKSLAETLTAAVMNYKNRAFCELQLVRLDGRILASSSAVTAGRLVTSVDFASAKWGGTGVFVGSSSYYEDRVMAISVPLKKSGDDDILGVLRLVISTSRIDSMTLFTIGVMVLFSVVLLVVVWMSSQYFISSIVRPMRIITESTRKIAEGDLSVRIENRYDDEIGVLCGAINDMAKGLSDSERIKNEFISSVSHELRTPLTSIKGWGETMQLCDPVNDSETIKRGLAVICEETRRLSQMVEELLDFSRLESGNIKLRLGPVDLKNETLHVVTLMRERVRREGLRLNYIISSKEDIVVRGDRDRLLQVLINILDNAIKYSPKDSDILLNLTIKDGWAVTEVVDNGPGIPPEEIPNIRKKFYKSDTAKRGSGIGLAVSDEIVAMHGGRLEIESVVSEGTKVSVWLPLAQDGEKQGETSQ